jgi:hypothetical protein
MSKIYYIDGIDITSYVLSEFGVTEQRNVVGEDLLRIGNFDLTLWNGDFRFSPHNPSSIFYGRSLYESFFYIIDDDIEIYRGRIKSISLDINNAILTVASFFDEMLDRTLVYIKDNINPADAVKEILILNNLDEYLDEFSYLFSKQILEDYGLIINVFFFIDSSTTIGQALQQLGEICGADVYFSNGKIHFLVWEQQQLGNNTFKISASQIEGYSITTDSDNIRNQYSYTLTLETAPNEAVQYSIFDTAFGKESRQLYGERAYNDFNLSDGQNFSTTAITALSDIGRNKVLRAKDPKKYIQFTVIDAKLPYPFTLKSTFSVDSDINDYVGEGLEDDIYQVVSLTYNDQKTTVSAVKIN